MLIEIDGKKIKLDDANAAIARDSVNAFVDVVRMGAAEKHNDALYLATLIMMFKKSTELLDEFGLDNLRYTLNRNQEYIREKNARE